MSEPGFASLGPTLLARKGGAKPAMRPQLPPLVQDEAELAALADEQLEDLGWNDMGSDDSDHGETDDWAESGADIVPINAAVSADEFADAPGPIVRRQQRRLEERVLADAVMSGPDDRDPEYDAEDDDGAEDDQLYGEEYAAEDEDGYEADLVAAMPPAVVVAEKRGPQVSAPRQVRRAAFTLRLDADRHLKLRLAATMQGISAQALVTEALDSLLAEYGDLDIIAAHLKRS
jgi:predicted HicB family RNase H-like nuclease